MFYEEERGTTTYGGQPATWTGKIGLMYPSDYGYATSGGTTIDRASCLAEELIGWASYDDHSDCPNNDYLHNTKLSQWTITHSNGNKSIVYIIASSGDIRTINISAPDMGLNYYFPTLYLNSSVTITGGTGTSDDPYTLG